MTLAEFRSNPPKSVKVYDPGLRKNIILDYCPEEGRYITRRNMGTRNRRVFHYWSLENAYKAMVNGGDKK
jgi:hypothetical protein